MTSSSKDRYFVNVAKSRRSSPGESQGSHSVFFQTGQGGRTVLPPLSDSFPTLRFPVPSSYSNPYTQPRSAPNKIGYDLNPQAFYSPYQPTSTSPQFQPPFANYEIHHERYSPQPSYPTYPSRTPPIIHNPTDSRRLPPLTTSSTPPGERWQQPSYVQPATGFPGNSIRSPTASYPPAYMTYSTNPANAYSYHIPAQDHASSISHQTHPAMYEEVPRLDPRSSSPYSRNSGSSHVSPPRVYTPPPISPTSPEEPTIKKKRKRADAAQLKVLNETYNRTAFPSTEERIALAKMLDMSARSVQIWFQNKRQSMRQTNRQSSTVGSGSHHPFSMGNTVDPMADDLVPHTSSGYDTSGPLAESMYLTSSSQDAVRSHASHSHSHSHSQHHHHHHHSSHRHRDQEEVMDTRKWSRAL